LEGYEKKLLEISTSRIALFDALDVKITQATTATEIDGVMLELKATRVMNQRQLGPFKRAVAVLKACIRKFESKDTKGMKKSKGKGKGKQTTADGSDDKPSGPTRGAVEMFLLTNDLQKQDHINMHLINDGAPRERGEAQLFELDKLKDITKDLRFLGTLKDWLQSQMEDDCSVCAPLSKSRHAKTIEEWIVTNLTVDSVMFEKPHSVLYSDVLHEVFSVNIVCVNREYELPGFLPNCIGAWFLPLDATLLMMGVKTDQAVGDSFVNKVTNFVQADENTISAVIKENGFLVKATPGKLVWIPPGYVIWITCLAPGSYVKWSTLSSQQGSEKDLVKTILGNATLLLASYPTLSDSYRGWCTYLQSRLD